MGIGNQAASLDQSSEVPHESKYRSHANPIQLGQRARPQGEGVDVYDGTRIGGNYPPPAFADINNDDRTEIVGWYSTSISDSNGYLFPVDSKNALAKKLISAIENVEFREEQIIKNRDLIHEKFDMNLIMNKLFDIYGEQIEFGK